MKICIYSYFHSQFPFDHGDVLTNFWGRFDQLWVFLTWRLTWGRFTVIPGIHCRTGSPLARTN